MIDAQPDVLRGTEHMEQQHALVRDGRGLDRDIVASREGMTDAGLSRTQSPLNGRVDGSPFPLQAVVSSESVDESKQEHAAHVSEDTTLHNNFPSDPAESGKGMDMDDPSSFPGVRAAPASPAPSHPSSPTLSHNTPQSTQTTETTKQPGSRRSSLSVKVINEQNGIATPVSAGRRRRPSTLIPRPGREGETIPPRYREDGEVQGREKSETSDGQRTGSGTGTGTKDAFAAVGDDADGTADGVNNADMDELPRQPRVVVRDFGFTASDPRYRGAFHPIPGEFEDGAEEEDDDDRGSTASGASSGWNRFTSSGRRKSSFGGWSGFGFGGFGFGGLGRRFSKSSRRGSQAGLSIGDDADSNRSGGSRRGSVQVGGEDGTPPTTTAAHVEIVLPPLPLDTDISLSDLTPSSSVDDEPSFGRYVFGAGGVKRANSSSRLRALSGAGDTTTPPTASGVVASIAIPEDPRLSILSQVSEEAHSASSDASSADESSKWPCDPTPATASASSGTTITAKEPRGRYKVLYAFEAEGEHEMSVVEGEELLIGGRWGNMGWVVAERVVVDGQRVEKGLVPEGYLGDKLGDR